MVEHRQVNRLISNSNMVVIGEEDRILQTCSLAFDVSVFEIWGTLLNGACLYLLAKEDLVSADRLAVICHTAGITQTWLTTPLFNQLLEENPAIFAKMKRLKRGTG